MWGMGVAVGERVEVSGCDGCAWGSHGWWLRGGSLGGGLSKMG